jgi:ADP-heptose:LPS heptosyltransferase
VVRPDEIGDVVLSSPFFRNLRRSAPNAHITVLTNPGCRSLVANSPHINEVYSLPFKPTTAPQHRASLVSAAIKLKLSRLRRGFELVLLPRVDADWYNAELVAHLLAGNGLILMNSAGFIKWSIHPPKTLGLADMRYEVGRVQSDALSNLEFLQWCGGIIDHDRLEFWINPSEYDAVKAWLGKGSTTKRTLIFHPPGSHSLLRRWPTGRSRELVQRLLDSTDFDVVVVGGPADEWLNTEFAGIDHPGLKLALKRFTIPELGALIQQCGYFVGGDSGPMHIAAAVGAHTFGIFGPGSEIRFKPLGDRARVASLRSICTPDNQQTYLAACHTCINDINQCMSDLTASHVAEQIIDAMHTLSWSNCSL